MMNLIIRFHNQLEIFFQTKFHSGTKFYPFHPGMKFKCKQNFFNPGTSFIPGWYFISVTCKHTLRKVKMYFSLFLFRRCFNFRVCMYLCNVFFDSIRNQTSNRKYIQGLIKRRLKVHQRKKSRERILNFDQ